MSESPTLWIPTCPETDVTEGCLTHHETEGRAFLLTRVEGEIRAFRNLCTHQFLVMDDCEAEGDSFQCPYHGVRYALATGEVTDDGGFNGIQALTSYPIRVTDGTVELEVPERERP
ncbi:MAG: Rieske 2Fe-2S domain-containing protein [Acidobacteriota bacterium]